MENKKNVSASFAQFKKNGTGNNFPVELSLITIAKHKQNTANKTSAFANLFILRPPFK